MKGSSTFVDLSSNLLGLISIMPVIIFNLELHFFSMAGLYRDCCSRIIRCKKWKRKKLPVWFCAQYLEPFALSFFSLHFLNTTPFFPSSDETDTRILTSLSQFGSHYMPSGNLAQDLCTISCSFNHKSCKSNNNASCRMKWWWLGKTKHAEACRRTKLAHVYAVIVSYDVEIMKMGQNLTKFIYFKEKCIKYYLERHFYILNEYFLSVSLVNL